MSEFEIRQYNPKTDYSDVKSNLVEAILFDADRDTPERLERFAEDVIVADVGGLVVGSVYVVNHIVPTFWRLVVKQDYRGNGVGSSLLGGAREKLKEGGALDFEGFFSLNEEELVNWYVERGMREGGNYGSVWQYTAKR